MPVYIATDDASALITIRFSGMTSREQLDEVLREIIDLHNSTGYRRVLVDAVQRKESLGMLELLEFGQAMSDPAFSGMRVAVFSEKPQPGLEFTRTVVSSRKLGAEMRTFVCGQAARAWLVGQEAADAAPQGA